MTLISFQNSVNATLWHHKFRKHLWPNFLLADATFQHSIITPIVHRSSASLFDTDVVTFSFTRLAMQVVTSDESWNISVLYCLQHITDTFHEFVLLNFSSSSNTKPPTVSTYRSLWFLLHKLNWHIAPWNSAVIEGCKHRFGDKSICFNTVTQFCSRLAFRVQFKRLL